MISGSTIGNKTICVAHALAKNKRFREFNDALRQADQTPRSYDGANCNGGWWLLTGGLRPCHEAVNRKLKTFIVFHCKFCNIHTIFEHVPEQAAVEPRKGLKYV